MTALKYDNKKPRLDLVSRVALEGLARVLAYGAEKYSSTAGAGEDNWRKGMEWRRLIAAALRHLMAVQDGEDIDPESGLPHIDHAQCCLMFLSEYMKKGIGKDDRYHATESSNDDQDIQNLRRPNSTAPHYRLDYPASRSTRGVF